MVVARFQVINGEALVKCPHLNKEWARGDEAGDIGWVAYASERSEFVAPLANLAVLPAGQPARERGFDDPGPDRVDGDPVTSEFLRPASNHHSNARFGGRVAPAHGARDLRGERGHEDDAAALALLDHLARARLRGEEPPDLLEPAIDDDTAGLDDEMPVDDAGVTDDDEIFVGDDADTDDEATTEPVVDTQAPATFSMGSIGLF